MAETPTLAERIRDEREWVGFTHAQVADALGLTEADLAAIEDGTRPVSETELKRLAKLFRLSVDRLLGEPLVEDPELARSMRGRDICHEDSYHVHRFAEFLRHGGA